VSDGWEAYPEVFPPETHACAGKSDGETNHVERWNNTLRQRLARFVRKSLSFSKKIEHHIAALQLFFYTYNSSVIT
jgi:insertion element IS1 protein InsB